MKATIEFLLPEDRVEHRLAIHGADFSSALTGIQEVIRRRLKYGDASEGETKTLEEILAVIPYDLLEDT